MSDQSEFKIRAVDGKDPKVAETIKGLHGECFGFWSPGLTKTGHWWLVTGPDGAPAGFAALWPSVRLPETGYLARAGIAPQARGHGLQRRLIRARERKARDLGWLVTITDTVEGNIHSANNLIRCGYLMYDPPVKYASPGSVYWKRDLFTGLA